MFFAEARLAAGAELALPAEHAEHGVHVIEGELAWGGLNLVAGQMAVQSGDAPALKASRASRVMLFGGAPLDGERHLWWNFVAADNARIEQAKADWREGRFPKVPGDEQEFIPLPD
jgi:redox-sensitive bicupin YhaK (pirin superfamily)